MNEPLKMYQYRDVLFHLFGRTEKVSRHDVLVLSYYEITNNCQNLNNVLNDTEINS